VVERLATLDVSCRGCGYSLRGVPEPACPECGRAVIHEDIDFALRPNLWTRLGPAALLGVAWAFLPAVLGLTLFVGYRGEAAEWLKGHELGVGVAIYVGAFVLGAGLGLLPTWVQAVIGGYAFGMWFGFAGALAGFTGASVVGYAVARVVARHRVEAEIESNVKARAVREALIGGDRWRVLGTVMLVRFPPNSPFALMNGLLAATEVPIGTYVLGTALGMTPRTLVYAWIGTRVSDWDTVGLPAWLKYGGLVVTLIVLGVIGQVANKAIEKVTKGQGEGVGEAEHGG